MNSELELVDQLTDQLNIRAHNLGELLGADLLTAMTERIAEVVPRIAAELESDDGKTAALALVSALWPTDHNGDSVPPRWWATPAGRQVARAAADEFQGSVTRRVAATMLARAPGTVARLSCAASSPSIPMAASPA